MAGRGDGEPRRYFESVVRHYRGDECLTWPFSKLNNGYGILNKKVVSRLACEAINGPPPTPRHDAAHSCGKGHLGCVNPVHMSWKTRKENMEDTVAHGTHNRGERQGSSKLSADQVDQIRAAKATSTQRAVAASFGISVAHVSNIQSGKAWSWLDGRQTT